MIKFVEDEVEVEILTFDWSLGICCGDCLVLGIALVKIVWWVY